MSSFATIIHTLAYESELMNRQVVEVPEGSADAKKWPLWVPPKDSNTKDSEADSSAKLPIHPLSEETTLQAAGPSTSGTEASTSSTPELHKPLAALGKRPGPRRPKTLLNAPVGKAKKLSTLEKSSMDWKSHLQAETMAGTQLEGELEANRRGGGYLERVEFMERVGARREEIFEQGRSTKRRKG